ncbi:MAG: hypothetical protein ACLSD6_09170 [Clostridium sp.]
MRASESMPLLLRSSMSENAHDAQKIPLDCAIKNIVTDKKTTEIFAYFSKNRKSYKKVTSG